MLLYELEYQYCRVRTYVRVPVHRRECSCVYVCVFNQVLRHSSIPQRCCRTTGCRHVHGDGGFSVILRWRQGTAQGCVCSRELQESVLDWMRPRCGNIVCGVRTLVSTPLKTATTSTRASVSSAIYLHPARAAARGHCEQRNGVAGGLP